jgi:exo-beta-1,3-glucanase (GH17 family)
VDAVDYVLVHIHPWWDARHGATITDPVRYVVDTYNEIRRQAPGKRVVIGEVGWPSDGQAGEQAVPGLREQCQFYTGFLRAADREHIPFYFFEAFDESWKVEPSDVGGHWGLHYADGTTKHKIQGML